MRLTTSARGINEVITKFKNAQGNFEAWRIVEIIRYCLQHVVDEARGRAPVRTGALRDSIDHIMLSENFPMIVGEAFVGAPYGAAVEYGYVAANGTKVKGANYFMPAAMRSRKMFSDMIKQYIKATVDGVAYTPPSSGRGGSKRFKKFQFKQEVGGKTRYKYGPKRGTVGRQFSTLKPSSRKKPSTRFASRYGGGASIIRG